MCVLEEGAEGLVCAGAVLGFFEYANEFNKRYFF